MHSGRGTTAVGCCCAVFDASAVRQIPNLTGRSRHKQAPACPYPVCWVRSRPIDATLAACEPGFALFYEWLPFPFGF